MKKSINIFFAALSILFIFQSVSMADGNELQKNCQMVDEKMSAPNVTEALTTKEEALDFGMCIGLVEGVRNAMIYQNGIVPKEHQLCWPKDGILNRQGVKIVLKYLNDHPERLHEDRVSLIMRAYIDAFKCE